MLSTVPKIMRQVVMAGTGGPEVLRVEDAEVPAPKDGEVLIDVRAAGVNRPDLAQRQGKYPPPPGASPILGLEVAGVVSAVGPGAGLKIGDRVCALTPGGGYAERCLAPASHCLPIPAKLSFEEAAGVPETFFTVWANVFQLGALKKGERFLVHGGTSGIGTTAIQLAVAFGAEAYATAGSDRKCSECVKLGAKAGINYKTSSFQDELGRLTGGRGVDVILDMVGGDYAARNLECLAFQGRLVQIATQQSPSATINLAKIMQKRLTLTGSTMRPRSIEEKAAIARELREKVWPLFESGAVRVIVDRVFELDDVRSAHEYLESGGHVGKVILRMGHDTSQR
jgi:putative PIG3 family NAD(P)H quinone oxidoreductase